MINLHQKYTNQDGELITTWDGWMRARKVYDQDGRLVKDDGLPTKEQHGKR